MNKHEVFAHFNAILQSMTTDEDWLDYLQNPWDSDIKIFTPTIRCCSGISRCALIDDEYEWIVKWDILFDDDYCEKEAQTFQEAKQLGIDDMMAEEEYVGDWVDEENYIYLRLYAAKRAISFSNGNYLNLEEEEHPIPKTSPLAERSKHIAAAFIHDWGIEQFEKLDKFCRNKRINDIHRGNVGLINGKVVLIDYAGYYNSSYSD